MPADSEPIAGDENPESYGASLASLSTDHILADNLRLTNYRYRLQMLPNDRIPGFMFHQSERSYNNGTGDDTGRPGDKINSDGYPLWKPDPIPGTVPTSRLPDATLSPPSAALG